MAKTATRNGSRSNGSANAQRFARQSRAKVDKKREQAEGVSGWVAERAGDWDLDAHDLRFMARQKYFWNPLID